MKTSILVGICAVFSLGAAGASGNQQKKSPELAAKSNSPESVACAQESGETLGQCAYSIRPDESGKTTITVAFANGFKRKLFFRNGKFLKASTTMSGTGTDTDWNLKDGMYSIRVDDQRYEVPAFLIVSD